MQIARTDELELLTVLHSGMHERPIWGQFLGRFVRRVGADSARLVVARGEAAIEVAARPFSRQVEMRTRALGEPGDAVPYGSLRPHRVYAFAEFLTPPAGQGRVLRADGEDLSAWLVVHNHEHEVSPSNVSLMSALAPHLSVALANHAALERGRLEHQVSDWALGRLGRGWLALTASGRVVAADELGERLLNEGLRLRRSADRRLMAGSAEANQRLSRAIEAAAADPGGGTRAVRIAEEPRLELLIAPLAADEADGPIFDAALVAHVQVAPPLAEEPVPALCALFDLSPAVARMAWALGRGGGVGEAAAELGLTRETARFYSKAVYAKLGVRGQAELARRLLTSTAALA